MTVCDVEDFETLGFVKLAEQGFAMLLYGRPQGNTLYVARSSLPGDHNSTIEAFEPCDVEDIVWISERRKRSASVGDRWLDVFVVRNEPYIGTPDQLWRFLSSKQRYLSDHMPISLFELAFNADQKQQFELATNAHNFVGYNFGPEKSCRWALSTFNRALTLAIQRIVRLEPGELDGAVRRDTGTSISLQLPPRVTASMGAAVEIITYLSDVLKLARAMGLEVDTSKIVSTSEAPTNARGELFEPGDYIVYPAHGVGQVLGVQRQVVASIELEVFRVEFEHERMILEVPLMKARSSGMRKLSSQEDIERSLKILRGRARRINRPGWIRRMHERINSGDLVAIASAARDLSDFVFDDLEEFESDRSSARAMLEKAVERIARELALVAGIDLSKARGAVRAAVQEKGD